MDRSLKTAKRLLALLLIICLIFPLPVFADKDKGKDKDTKKVVATDKEIKEDEDEFEGWDEEAVDDACGVLSNTDWLEVTDLLNYDDIFVESTAKAVNLSKKVEKLRNKISGFLEEEHSLTAKTRDTWVELMLACIEVLTDGKAKTKKPWNKTHPKANNFKGRNREEAYEALYERLIGAEEMIRGQDKFVDLYYKDKYFKSMVESVVMTKQYSAKYPGYTISSANSFKRNNKDLFHKKYSPSEKYALDVCDHYRCMSTGGMSGARAKIIAAAYSQIGVPYKWGGTTPGVGLDCSGLTQYCYKCAGISIPRKSGAQLAGGTVVTNPKPGDICWTPGHVAIYIGGGKMIEAQQDGVPVKESDVRVDKYVRYIQDDDIGGLDYDSIGGEKWNGKTSTKARKVVTAARSCNRFGVYGDNWCSRWVRCCYNHCGVMSYGGASATAAFVGLSSAASRAKHGKKMGTIPPGAAVFGTGRGSGGAGHVGIYLGGGQVADYIGAGPRISSLPQWLSWQTDSWHGKQGWLGWALPHELIKK